jgi:hypothetical protein
MPPNTANLKCAPYPAGHITLLVASPLVTKTDDELTSFTPMGDSARSGEEHQRSCAPEVLSRGLCQLPLFDLFPYVHAAVEGRGQRVPFEDERRGSNGALN